MRKTISRKLSVLILLGAMIAFGAQAPATAQVADPEPMPEAMGDLTLQPVEELDQDSLSPKLANGSVADPKEWPASFYGVYRIENRDFNCTATLVAPRALLTAAHCIADGGSVVIGREQASFSGTCERASGGYPIEKSLDVALCLMKEDVPADRYERISLDPALLKLNMQLLLAGFGCTSINGESDQTFRTGPAFVEYLPGESGTRNWIFTYPEAKRKGAFICPGDSGGGAFYEQLAADQRYIVAVNSHYNTTGNGVSYLTALSTPKAAGFVRDWAQRNGQPLCGVHDGVQKCR